MKTLYIMRHAQKDHTDPNAYDYDIELTKQGFEDAKLMGIKLKEEDFKPDLIVSSPATRARQTAETFCKEIHYYKNIMYNEVIYQAFLNEIIESITYTFDSVNTLLIIGHNPSLTALGVTFAGLKEELPMGAIAKIEFYCNSWVNIDRSNAKLVKLYKL